MKLSEIMSINPKVVESTCSVREAVDIMLEYDIRHVPVVSGKEIVGILSDRDLRGLAAVTDEEGYKALHERLGQNTSVTSVMSGSPITIDVEAELSEAIEIMLEQKIGALPVVDEGTRVLRGIVSYEDVLRVALELIDQ